MVKKLSGQYNRKKWEYKKNYFLQKNCSFCNFLDQLLLVIRDISQKETNQAGAVAIFTREEKLLLNWYLKTKNSNPLEFKK